jgi:PAS domain S-box-containing protein
VLGGAILLFTAIVFAVSVALNEPLSGVATLYVLPIALVALEWGMRAGLVAAAAAAGLFVAWVHIDSVPMGALGYAARPFIYLFIALLVGLVAQRLRAATSEQARATKLRRAILETSNEAFIAVDRDGLMTDWNRAAERTFGWSAEEAVGKPLSEILVPPELREAFTEGLRRYLETGKKTLLGRRVETNAIRRDGGEIPVELSSATVGEGPDLRMYAFVRDISERKESERRLEHAARYFELSHDLIATATPDLYLDQVNSRWQTALGWTPEELRDRPLLDFIHPDDRELTAKEFTRVTQGEESVDFINRYRAKDGSWHSLEWSAVLSPEENRVYGAARDVTERLKADEANRRLGAIVDSSSDAIYGYSLDGKITSWNDAAERLYGYAAREAVGMHLSQLAPPDRPDDTAAILALVSRGEVAEAREAVRIAKDGRSVDVSVTAAPTRGAGGSLVGGSTIARDISDRKRTLRYMGAQHRVTAILATAPEVADIGAQVLPIIAGCVRCTHALYWSASDVPGELRCDATWTAPRLRGPVPPVRMGATWKPGAESEPDALRESIWESNLEPTSEVPLAERAVVAGMAAGMWLPVMSETRVQGGFEFFDRENREPDDELLTVLMSVVAQIGHYTQRRHAEEEAERVKTEFFSLISHELRSPLTSIIGYTEILAETEADRLTDEGRRFLEVVERNGRRELRLVQDLLMLVRIEAGTFSIEPGLADLKQIAEDSIEAARPSAERQGVGLSLQGQPVPEFEADPQRLGQVIDNLLTNAIKFSPDGGEVAVRLHRENGSALIEVSDTGMGVPADAKERLFERLFRTKGATTMQIPGTGLGLSIVKAIVDAHGGGIELESQEGEGTTFRIDLPMHTGDKSETNGQREKAM